MDSYYNGIQLEGVSMDNAAQEYVVTVEGDVVVMVESDEIVIDLSDEGEVV